jgi:putative endonuclease
MKRGGHVYILTNKTHSVLYIGVTSDLVKRLYEHQNKVFPNSFTARYNCNKLIFHEFFSRIEEAIAREKSMKKWKREWKENLINSFNPEWKNLGREVENW